jgi:hypothetical protein
MRGQFCGHLSQQPRPLHHPIEQVRAHIGEAQRGHAGGDAFLGVAPPLPRQPLRAGCQPHPQPHQCRLHLPVAHPKLGGDPGEAVAGVAAGLQIPAQILKPQHSTVLVQAPIAAAIDHEPALKDQPPTRFRCLWVCPCVAGPAWDHDRQMPVDQRLGTAIALAEATATGREVHRSGLAQPSEIPADQELCARGQRRVGAAAVAGWQCGVTTNAWATQATVGPERFIRGRFYPLHLHRHAFVTPHLRDRSGRCATAVVTEIAAGSAPPDRRRRCAPGREREIVAYHTDSWPR